jgi:NAD(P)-dependent dehydrogenase (short-subunit alcohol dehydrogenase family)
MGEWGDQVAIVTGGGKGLGRAFALDLARRGARVVAEIRAAGGTAVAHHGAVEDPGSAESMVELALGEWGHLDILITSAGISRRRCSTRRPSPPT